MKRKITAIVSIVLLVFTLSSIAYISDAAKSGPVKVKSKGDTYAKLSVTNAKRCTTGTRRMVIMVIKKDGEEKEIASKKCVRSGTTTWTCEKLRPGTTYKAYLTANKKWSAATKFKTKSKDTRR